MNSSSPPMKMNKAGTSIGRPSHIADKAAPNPPAINTSPASPRARAILALAMLDALERLTPLTRLTDGPILLTTCVAISTTMRGNTVTPTSMKTVGTTPYSKSILPRIDRARIVKHATRDTRAKLAQIDFTLIDTNIQALKSYSLVMSIATTKGIPIPHDLHTLEDPPDTQTLHSRRIRQK